MRPIRYLAFALLVAMIAGCSAFAGSPNLGARNGTTIEVAIVVNNVEIGRLAPGESIDDLQGRAGRRPWLIQLRTITSGRAVLTMRDDPTEGEPAADANGLAAVNAFLVTVDLSCGRLEAWTGDRSAIAAPPIPDQPGRPGDCEP